MASKELFFGHSSDFKDAFMFYALARNKIPTGDYKIIHIFQDIQKLNERSVHGELDITVISTHAYCYSKRKYVLMRTGVFPASRTGPIVVSKYEIALDELSNKIIAIPGTMTSEFLALRIAIGDFDYYEQPAEKILDLVKSGTVDAGLIMHEGIINYESLHLYNIFDVGHWWNNHSEFPLPLTAIAINRSLGNDIIKHLCVILERCIAYSIDNFDEAIEYAMNFNQSLSKEEIEKIMGKYIDNLLFDVQDKSEKAITVFLSMAEQRKLIPPTVPIDFAPRF